MKINWKVRVKSLWFWLTLVPAALLLAQVCAAPRYRSRGTSTR